MNSARERCDRRRAQLAMRNDAFALRLCKEAVQQRAGSLARCDSEASGALDRGPALTGADEAAHSIGRLDILQR